MKQEYWNTFFVCAIGAGIGSLIALEMSPLFWWVGLIVGGLIGYLSYEWRAVVRAFPAAWRAARGWQLQLPSDFWLMFALNTGVFLSVLIDMISIVMLPVFAGALVNGDIDSFSSSFLIFVIGILTAVTVIALSFGFWDAMSRNVEGEYRVLRDVVRARHVMRIVFPPFFFLWHSPRFILLGVIKGAHAMGKMIIRLPRFARFLRRFSWELFVRIHSERRLLRSVDIMLGTAVGYFAGSALVGAAIGGIFGLIDQAIITEGWLRPKGYIPVRPS